MRDLIRPDEYRRELEAIEQRCEAAYAWDLWACAEHEALIDAMVCRLVLENCWPFDLTNASAWTLNNRGEEELARSWLLFD